MSKHSFSIDQTGTGCTPSPAPGFQYRHNLRYENPAGGAWTSPEGHTLRTTCGLTVVTCACGLATEALPSNDARLVYEEHRNAIRDEMT
ncbi:hypothetical protein AR457_02530 [Streptomyces agglomeratus]|uniref:Uncharacterized protein n=1 Tax=Streptomyces agglomeratus TaxID=285458 RepID=A0A1E5P205_9ACTN|nr:hypothetical protein [Streptomyces agglomeratus]OEJ23542.1 hypothetical protein AS594_02630 [Streptomyces agglomeratus]OEJ43137.1 hypothetical protein AR457_02530 [Streptomyces agglomeratus]OEJ54943.1 hypothetical protein BGK72_33245 [Streptomyces agglomeratus]OEJ62314.1 hypothetical protein BGM19_34165 [Streptomyces agglomeratus]